MTRNPDDPEYAGPTGRELPGEHWNARVLRELSEQEQAVLDLPPPVSGKAVHAALKAVEDDELWRRAAVRGLSRHTARMIIVRMALETGR